MKLTSKSILAIGTAIFAIAFTESGISAEGTARWCLPAPFGLTNWWPGDGNADDIVGGLDGELLYGAKTRLALVDQAFVLHGGGDDVGDFVDVPDSSALDFGTSDFTVNLWAFFNDPSTGEQVLIEKWIQDSGGWTLTKVGGDGEDNKIVLAGPVVEISSQPVAIRAGTWTHFAATRRAGFARIFMNGREIASGSFPDNLDSSSSLKFGRRGDDRGFFLTGGIDEVQIFVGRALPQLVIWAIYEAGSRGMCKRGSNAAG